MFRLIFQDSFFKSLSKLHHSEQRRILQKIQDLAENKENVDVRKLQPKQEGLYRLRIGKYRVIFEYKKQEIICFKVDSRDKAYFFLQ